MNIAVFVKASLDPNMIRVDSAGRILIDEIPLAISEYDRNAVEEAMRIKEKFGGKIHAFSVLTWGPLNKRINEAEQVLREALAMGVDEAHLFADEAILPGFPSTTAKILSTMVKKVGDFDIYLTGEASMDVSSAQMAARIAEYLNLPAITYVRKLEINGNKIRATRDLEDRLEVIETSMPAVISVTGEINKPRYPTLLQIRRAFIKPLNKYKLSDLNLHVEINITRESIELLTVTRKNIIVEGKSLDEVAEKLINALLREGVIK